MQKTITAAMILLTLFVGACGESQEEKNKRQSEELRKKFLAPASESEVNRLLEKQYPKSTEKIESQREQRRAMGLSS
ncbi:hypothetical protein [Cupriavidus sp. CP313]